MSTTFVSTFRQMLVLVSTSYCSYVTVANKDIFLLTKLILCSTDVKEFVHGDLGRTKPSVGTLLGCKADILELDCEGIECG